MTVHDGHLSGTLPGVPRGDHADLLLIDVEDVQVVATSAKLSPSRLEVATSTPGATMLIAVTVLTIASIATLIAAMILDNGVIAAVCAGVCTIALLVLIIDARRASRRPDPRSGIEPALPEEHHHSAGDELFGEHDVQRDMVREERVLNSDMLGQNVPDEEGQRY